MRRTATIRDLLDLDDDSFRSWVMTNRQYEGDKFDDALELAALYREQAEALDRQATPICRKKPNPQPASCEGLDIDVED